MNNIPLEPNTNKESNQIAPNTKQATGGKKEGLFETNIVQDSISGINLVPVLSKEEVIKEEKKEKLNISSILSIIFFLLITFIIVGLNITFKLRLNNAKESLGKLEEQIHTKDSKIVDNNDIVDRIFLYQDIEKTQYSIKAVVEYVNNIAIKNGDTKLILYTFSGKDKFSFEGESDGLENASKFWYLLNTDPNINGVEMEYINKGSETVRFKFNTQIKVENFLKSA